VVIAIIAVLISILMPSLSRAKEIARRAGCALNQRNIHQGSILFAHDHDAALPAVGGHPGNWNWDAKYDLGGGNRPDIPGAAELLLQRLWKPDPSGRTSANPDGQGYLDNRDLMRCPSRTDHWPRGMPGIDNNLIIAERMWVNFWSTYHYSGGSAQWAGEKFTCDWVYRVSLDKQEPGQTLLADLVHPEEPSSDWPWLKQTNHWSRNQLPEGGNTTRIDGATLWVPWNAARWHNSYNSWLPNGTHFVWLTRSGWYSPDGAGAYFFSDWPNFSSPKRGVLLKPPG